jgi:hypothetical protein
MQYHMQEKDIASLSFSLPPSPSLPSTGFGSGYKVNQDSSPPMTFLSLMMDIAQVSDACLQAVSSCLCAWLANQPDLSIQIISWLSGDAGSLLSTIGLERDGVADSAARKRVRYADKTEGKRGGEGGGEGGGREENEIDQWDRYISLEREGGKGEGEGGDIKVQEGGDGRGIAPLPNHSSPIKSSLSKGQSRGGGGGGGGDALSVPMSLASPLPLPPPPSDRREGVMRHRAVGGIAFTPVSNKQGGGGDRRRSGSGGLGSRSNGRSTKRKMQTGISVICEYMGFWCVCVCVV